MVRLNPDFSAEVYLFSIRCVFVSGLHLPAGGICAFSTFQSHINLGSFPAEVTALTTPVLTISIVTRSEILQNMSFNFEKSLKFSHYNRLICFLLRRIWLVRACPPSPPLPDWWKFDDIFFLKFSWGFLIKMKSTLQRWTWVNAEISWRVCSRVELYGEMCFSWKLI